MKENSKEQDALKRIAEIAKSALENGHSKSDDQPGGGGTASAEEIGCSIKQLPDRLQKKAAEMAIQINPTNGPVFEMMNGMAAEMVTDPMFLTLLTSKYWGSTPRQLTVSFMESTPANLRARIVSHMNAWNKTACISFVQTAGTGKVRISRGPGGYWSYLGTDVLLIPTNRPTMNLQNFSMSTPESEFIRVVRHETGHTMGFPHEHMRQELVNRIDPQKAYEYFLRTQGWSKTMVDQQVLTPLSAGSIIGTPADQTSIMCYQLPGSITKDGKPITGGVDINATDYAFARKVYPKPAIIIHGTSEPLASSDEWEESDDVDDRDLESSLQETTSTHNGH